MKRKQFVPTMESLEFLSDMNEFVRRAEERRIKAGKPDPKFIFDMTCAIFETFFKMNESKSTARDHR